MSSRILWNALLLVQVDLQCTCMVMKLAYGLMIVIEMYYVLFLFGQLYYCVILLQYSHLIYFLL